MQKQLFHLQAQRFESSVAARTALEVISDKWKYHRVVKSTLSQHIQYAQKGRPTPKTPIKAIRWPIRAQVAVDDAKITAAGTSIGANYLKANRARDFRNKMHICEAECAETQYWLEVNATVGSCQTGL